MKIGKQVTNLFLFFSHVSNMLEKSWDTFYTVSFRKIGEEWRNSYVFSPFCEDLSLLSHSYVCLATEWLKKFFLAALQFGADCTTWLNAYPWLVIALFLGRCQRLVNHPIKGQIHFLGNGFFNSTLVNLSYKRIQLIYSPCSLVM